MRRSQRESCCRLSKAPAVRGGGKVRGRARRATEVRDWWSVAGDETSKGAASVRAFPIPHGVATATRSSGENDTFCSGCVNGEGGGNAVSHTERRNPLNFKQFGRGPEKRRARSRLDWGCIAQKMDTVPGARNALCECELCGLRRAREGNTKKKLPAPKKRKCLHLCRVRRASGTR